jgi:hypothetical protein
MVPRITPLNKAGWLRVLVLDAKSEMRRGENFGTGKEVRVGCRACDCPGDDSVHWFS